MHKKKKTMLTLILIIVSFSVIFSGCIQQEKKQQKQDKISLQQLINNAQPGDTIYLPSQTYTGIITINKPLKLIGEDKHTTIIDGDYGETVIHIKVDGVTVTNLTIRNSGGYLENSGIKIETDNNLVDNCVIYRTKTGIYSRQW